MQMTKRGLLRPGDLPVEGKEFKVIEFRPSIGDFFKYDLVLSDGQSKSTQILGLQQTSFNVDSLIELLGDETKDWPGNWIKLYPADWKGINVIRIKDSTRQRHAKTEK